MVPVDNAEDPGRTSRRVAQDPLLLLFLQAAFRTRWFDGLPRRWAYIRSRFEGVNSEKSAFL